MTDTDALDKAVADVLGLERDIEDGTTFYHIPWPSAPEGAVYCSQHPSQDWNALMAAVAKLEERVPNSFERVATNSPSWRVHFTDGSAREDFEFGDLASEALALAECIYAVVPND